MLSISDVSTLSERCRRVRGRNRKCLYALPKRASSSTDGNALVAIAL
jgi:hypothetical protein